MTDMDAFDRLIARQVVRGTAPSRPVDDAAIFVAITTNERLEWRFWSMFTATKFVVAVAIVALFGGFLLSGIFRAPPDEPAPAAYASTPIETALVPSPSGHDDDVSAAIRMIDWTTIEDAPIFEGATAHELSVAPDGRVVILGLVRRDLPDGGVSMSARDGFIWSSPDGQAWERVKLPEVIGPNPDRVYHAIATQDGFVAIGARKRPGAQGLVRVISTSKDGIDWSPIRLGQPSLRDLVSVGDTVVITGMRGQIPTVWISRAGRPWQAAAIADQSTGFSPDQLAVSGDGRILVRDDGTGEAYLSDDGSRFVSVDLPDLPEGRHRLVGFGEGFVLMLNALKDQSLTTSLTTWVSPDGREWRRGDGPPGYVVGWLDNDGAAALMSVDRDGHQGRTYLAFLQSDGTWCSVSSPAMAFGVPGALSDLISDAAWTEDGRIIVLGSRERYADPIIWQAEGVRCDP